MGRVSVELVPRQKESFLQEVHILYAHKNQCGRVFNGNYLIIGKRDVFAGSLVNKEGTRSALPGFYIVPTFVAEIVNVLLQRQ